MSLSSLAAARTCNHINKYLVLVGRCSLLRWLEAPFATDNIIQPGRDATCQGFAAKLCYLELAAHVYALSHLFHKQVASTVIHYLSYFLSIPVQPAPALLCVVYCSGFCTEMVNLSVPLRTSSTTTNNTEKLSKIHQPLYI